MPASIWSQDIFSKGELSPLMNSRVTVTAYYNGLKTAQNCITYPQGAIGKRFGTIYNATIQGASSYQEIFFTTFQYLNECVYQIVFVPNGILVYLEGILVFNVNPTGFTAPDIRNINTTVLDNRMRITTGIYKPKDLFRSPTPTTTTLLTGVASDQFILGVPAVAGIILPVVFSVSGGTSTKPVTVPSLSLSVTYFAYYTSANTIEIYATSAEAKARINKFQIVSLGIGTNLVSTFNSWHINDVVFSNYPVFDFTETNAYANITFTPNMTTGYDILLTTDAPIFTAAHVGGAFFGLATTNAGIGRLTQFISTTTMRMNIVVPFANTTGIPGSLCLLTEPAWSDARGWPNECSSFQNRSVFANSKSLPNGLWLSVTNDYNNFDGLEALDTSAIAWNPSSDNVNYIRFVVPYRSLTIHTNTGIYSTPLSFETAITPTNFSMTLQDSTPATSIEPRGIDNQIIILSGNDVHSMLWDGFNNSYTSNIASIANEHLIRSPHDEAPYVNLNKAGSRYLFIINDNGTMAIFQTLISEDVAGFTPAQLKQSFGNAYFRWVASSSDGRAWFITERDVAEITIPFAINGYTTNSLYIGENFLLLNNTPFLLLNGDNFDLLSANGLFPIGIPTPFVFTTSGTLPASSPQVELNTIYWAMGQLDGTFYVYLNQQDAEDGVNNITFTSAGTGANVTPWTTTSQFMLEELSFDVFTDCTYTYVGGETSMFPGLDRFIAQDVKINGDGAGFDYISLDGTVETIAHGRPVAVREAAIGFPIETIIEPMQVAPPGPLGAKSASLVYPQHIRVATFMFNETKGGAINGTPIQLKRLSDTIPGDTDAPVSGQMELSFMLGWNQKNGNGITITHDDPFDIKLIGIFYKIES